jgi:hypothetical protein
VTLPLLAILPAAAVVSMLPAYGYLGRPSAADLTLAAMAGAGAAPDEVAIVARWQLVERLGLRNPPIEGYRFLRTPDADGLAGRRLVVTTDPDAAAALAAMGFAMTEQRGAPGGYPPGALWDAIRARDLGPLRERWGEPVWIGVRP